MKFVYKHIWQLRTQSHYPTCESRFLLLFWVLVGWMECTCVLFWFSKKLRKESIVFKLLSFLRAQKMVFFTCNACGESLKKAQVEKHYLHKCRQCEVLTCVDCHKVRTAKWIESLAENRVLEITIYLFNIHRIFPEIRTKNTPNAFQRKRNIVLKAGNPKPMRIKVPKSRKSG